MDGDDAADHGVVGDVLLEAPLEGVEVIEDAVVLLGGEAPPLGALVRFEFNELVEPHSNRGWSRAGLNVAGGGRKRERWKTRTGR